MIAKVCTNCGKASYSSSRRGLWKCASCQYDITNSPFLSPEEADKKNKEQERRDEEWQKQP